MAGLVTSIKLCSKSINDSQSAPLYEDVQSSFPDIAKNQEREFKLEENVAYGPARSIK